MAEALSELPDLSKVPVRKIAETPANQPCCGNCAYFFPVPKTKDAGNCRRYAPAPLIYGMAQHQVTGEPIPLVGGYFPQTRAHIVCGEHPRWEDFVHPTELANATTQGSG